MDYQKIKQTDEYQEILTLGYKDVTTSRKIQLGSLEFVGHETYSVTGRSGIVTRLPQGEWRVRKIAEIGQLLTIKDYKSALQIILEKIISRNQRVIRIINKLKKQSHDVLITIFTDSQARSLRYLIVKFQPNSKEIF
jgi:hypothetical protein